MDIRKIAETCGAAAEEFGLGTELGMDLQTDYRFPSTVARGAVRGGLFACSCRVHAVPLIALSSGAAKTWWSPMVEAMRREGSFPPVGCLDQE